MNNVVVQNSIVSSITSHFSTNNIVIDSLITIIISTLLVKLFNVIDITFFQTLWAYIYNTKYKIYECNISYSYTLSDNGWNHDPDTKYNEDLIRSVEKYLTKNKSSQTKYSLKLVEHDTDSGNLYDRVKSREIMDSPEQTIRLDHPYSDITIKITKEKTAGEKSTTIKEDLTIKSHVSSENIDSFVQMCYSDYIKKYDIYKRTIDDRHLYLHSYKDKTVQLNRYKISDNSNFDKIFFPEKKSY